MGDRLYIVIPAYNEEETIQRVVTEWYEIVEKLNNGSKLVIINDGSTDKTKDILQKMGESYPLLIAINKKNEGHGAAILFGYRYSIKENSDFIFQTDSDGQTESREFWDFWKLRNHYDMVIGNRNKRQDGISRIFVTKVLKIIIKLIFGVKVTDANTPYRLMKTAALKEYIDLIPSGFNLSNVIISVIYAKKELTTKYLPITFRPRQGGKNSINLKSIVKIGKQAIKDFKIINDVIN